MKLGVALPIVDIGGEPDAIRDFAQAAEAIGYQGIAAPDHVLGVNVASRPEWTQGRARSTDLYHDPFVLFGFLAGCTEIARFLDPGADPAAAPDRAGRQAGGLPRRLVGRPVPARRRGRLERGRVHRAQRGFPQSWPALGRAGRGDAGAVGRAACRLQGQMAHDRRRRHQPAARAIGQGAAVVWRPRRCDAAGASSNGATAGCRSPIRRAKRRRRRSPNCARYAEAAGRDPATIGIDTRVSAAGEEAQWRADVQFWKSCGVTHLTLANYYQSGHLRRIAGRSLGDHIAAMTRYWNAVADLL